VSIASRQWGTGGESIGALGDEEATMSQPPRSDGYATTRHDCRHSCRIHHSTTSYIEPGSPWENPFVGSFNGRARDDLLNIEEFGTLLGG
jgi:hypothetical protein